MDKQRHIIKRQIIEFNLSSQQGAFELQNEVSRIYRRKLIPLIDDLLSQFFDSNTIYRINTLEINLGNIDINNLEQELIDKFLEQIQQQLTKIINLSTSDYLTQSQPNMKLDSSSVQLGTIEVLSNKRDEKQSKNTRDNQEAFLRTTRYEIPSNETEITNIISKKASEIQILSYFIQTGMLPWWSEKLSKQDIEEYCARLISTSPKQLKYLVEESLKNEPQWQRIIYQFSDATLLKIMKLFAGDLFQLIADYYTIIKASFHQIENSIKSSETKLRREVWRGIFNSLYLKSHNTKIEQLRLIEENLLNIASSLAIDYPQLIRKVLTTVGKLEAEGIHLKSSLTELLTILTNDSPNHLEINISSQAELKQWETFPDSIEPFSDSRVNDPLKQLEINISPDAKSKQLKTFPDWIEPFSDSDEIYISNGGLVLLWPFLNRFFSKIKLVENNCFVNAVAAERATLLLQYLVDASVDSSEHILPLNKILCGIDLLEPIETSLEITEQEQSECENLLSTVIQNWSILRNTSIDGFRKAFLQRNSILRVRDGEWLLQLERKTYDILLDRIPWSIRFVKLPWMENILYVEQSDGI